MEDVALTLGFNKEVVFLKNGRGEQWQKLRVDSCCDLGAVRNTLGSESGLVSSGGEVA